MAWGQGFDPEMGPDSTFSGPLERGARWRVPSLSHRGAVVRVARRTSQRLGQGFGPRLGPPIPSSTYLFTARRCVLPFPLYYCGAAALAA